MARIDMTTREWHTLITPVLPHASTDRDDPALGVIRLNFAPGAVYAVATDRYTLAAERYLLAPASRLTASGPPPVHLRAAEAAASLRLYRHSKDDDPPLRITVDTVPVPIEAAGQPGTVRRYAVTLESPDGTRLVLHDHRDPAADPLGGWQKILAGLFARPLATNAHALSLAAGHLGKWAKAARPGEQVALYPGDDGGPVLVLAGDHFAAAWVQVNYLQAPGKFRGESPWQDDLAAWMPGTGGEAASA